MTRDKKLIRTLTFLVLFALVSLKLFSTASRSVIKLEGRGSGAWPLSMLSNVVLVILQCTSTLTRIIAFSSKDSIEDSINSPPSGLYLRGLTMREIWLARNALCFRKEFWFLDTITGNIWRGLQDYARIAWNDISRTNPNNNRPSVNRFKCFDSTWGNNKVLCSKANNTIRWLPPTQRLSMAGWLPRNVL